MADVLITPADGKIEFKPLGSGQATVSALEGAGNTLNLVNTSNVGGAVFNIDGASGSLFSVVDTLDGTLMSVNNSAGLPVFEVFSDDSIVAGRFNQNDFVITSDGDIGIGTATPDNKLTVSGDVNVASGSGFKINNSATAGNFLRGDGTRFVANTVQDSDLGSGTANSSAYLRGDRTWQVLNPAAVGAAPASHAHSADTLNPAIVNVAGEITAASANISGELKADILSSQHLTRLTRKNPAGMIRVVSIKSAGNVSMSCKSSTGYCAILWWDGSVEIAGNGTPGGDAVFFKAVPTTGNWSRSAPKEIFVWSCTSGNATQSGNLTAFSSGSYEWAEIDVADLSALTTISIFGLSNQITTSNKITTIDLRGCVNLTTLIIQYSPLDYIDLSHTPNLLSLNISGCALTSIDDLKQLPNTLTSFTCNNNSFSVLNLSSFADLLYLNCANNALTTLNISTSGNLLTLNCSGNQNLTSLVLDAPTQKSLDLKADGCGLTNLRAVNRVLPTTDKTTKAYFEDSFTDIRYNNLSASALNQFYTDIINVAPAFGYILVTGNPGLATDDPTIATNKGYILLEL